MKKLSKYSAPRLYVLYAGHVWKERKHKNVAKKMFDYYFHPIILSQSVKIGKDKPKIVSFPNTQKTYGYW